MTNIARSRGTASNAETPLVSHTPKTIKNV